MSQTTKSTTLKAPEPILLLELYQKVQELLNLKGPAYPTNILSVETDTHTMDTEGRCLIRLTTVEQAGLLSTIAILSDPAQVPEPYQAPTGVGTISPEVAASFAPIPIPPPPTAISFKKKPAIPAKTEAKQWP